MKRYFYTDPLAAAWMAKHFGMQIFAWATDSVSDCEHIARDKRCSPPSQNYLVDACSLSLLEPQEFDMVLYPDGAFTRIVGSTVGIDKAKITIGNGGKIIQRNGISFMWPESEAA
jgi:hypothetical protein